MPEQSIAPNRQLLQRMQSRAEALHADDQAPPSLEAWQESRQKLRKKLLEAWGGFPDADQPPKVQNFGELKRDGYRVEKIALETRPGVWMTANAYVPDAPGKHPAVLSVHGHWKGAKQDPVVQSRCIGLAKHGFFVLCVDAFGAGERGVGKALGEYHGEMVAATLFPTGLPLSGLQVYENMRAVDYLQSREEVDGTKIGITGASGGGNQTMYAGAFDERFGCVVPVCSVGNYRAYIGAACCMCEVVPNALTFTEEAGLLSLVAPRGLMIINATRDSFQFSVGEAKKSIAATQPVFELYGKPAHLRHTIFESKHDYSRPMREAMYGWMAWHLKGEGNGDPLPEPEFKTEIPEDLRCFPGDSRPDDFITIPKFAQREARKILARRKKPDHREHWEANAETMKLGLTAALGANPKRSSLELKSEKRKGGELSLQFHSEPGIALTASLPTTADRETIIILHLDGADAARKHPVAQTAAESGNVVFCDLRGTGTGSVAGDHIGRAPDHNSAEWAMWTGRPLLGQWVWDVRRLVDAMGEAHPGSGSKVTCIGIGPAGIVAMTAAAMDSRIHRVAAVETLGTYVTDAPYEGQRLGILVPGILREVGDIAELAALTAPRRLVIAGPVSPQNRPLGERSQTEFQATTHMYALLEAPGECKILDQSSPAEIVTALRA